MNSIKMKIFIFFIIISILPLLVLTALNYMYSVSIMKDEISKSNKALLAQTGENLDGILQMLEDKMWSFVILDMQNNNRYVAYLGKGAGNNSGQALDDVKAVSDILSSFADTNKYIDSIYLYSFKENYLVSSRKNTKILENMENYDWYNKAREAGGKVAWMATRQVIDIDGNSEKQLLSAVLLIKSNTGEEIGILCVNLKSDIIKHLTSHINIGEKGYILICDDQGNIINHRDKHLISTNMSGHDYIASVLSGKEGYFENRIDAEEYMITYFTSPYTGWKFAAVIPYKEITQKIYWKAMISILICLVCVPAAIFFALMISNNLYTPIKVLKNAMKKAADGDFSSRIEDLRKDEFRELNVSFNAMVGKIDNTIKELYQARLLQKEAELKALQSQINPHFLYNTLDSMYWMARLSRTEELGTMISSFSKFLKINLSKGRDIICIKEVVEEIQYYLTIQKFRFGDKFDTAVDVDPELYPYSMIKFLMQPLVENAIYHGIERKKGKGSIRITGRKEGEHVKFSVMDDGLGMSAERLQQVQESIEHDMEHRNFALVNVSRRIKTTYGGQYRLDIRSEEGKGTAVEVVIPLIRYNFADQLKNSTGRVSAGV